MFFKDSLHTLIIRVFGYFSAFLVQVLVANSLGASSKGELQVAIFLMSLMSLIVGLGFERAIIYNIGRKLYPLQQIWSSSIVYLLIGVVGGVIVLTPLFYLARPIFGEISFALLLLAFLLVPFNCFFSFQLGVYNGSGQLRLGNRFSLLESLLFVGFVAVFVLWLRPSTSGVLMAYIMAFLLAGFISAVYLAHRYNLNYWPRSDGRLIREFMLYGAKGQIGNITKLIATRVDLLLMNFFLGTISAGIYSVALNFGDALFFLPYVLAYVIFPHASRRDEDQAWILTARATRVSFAITLVGAVVIAIVAPIVVPIIYPGEFSEAVKPLWILLPGIVLFSTFRVLSAGLSGLGYPLIQSICTVVAVVFSIILNLILIPEYQHIGAALASTISFSLSLIALLAIIKIKFKMRLRDFLVPTFADFKLIFERLNDYLRRRMPK